MSNTSFFIDLPNFYSCLLRSNVETPKFLRDYVLNWLDFDLLARSLTDAYSGIWNFYSGERIGPSSERIDRNHLHEFVRRINALQGVTARDVNIPGEQREPSTYKCEKCGYQGFSETVSEKGIDSSLTVHLFDTMDSWDTAFVLSGDADFVPVVASLRRRGKIVIGVGFSNASTALVRECYDYVNIEEIFLKQDVLACNLFKKDGIVHKWLFDEVKQTPALSDSSDIELRMYLGPNSSWYRYGFSDAGTSSYSLYLRYKGSLDLSKRNKLITDLQTNFSDYIEDEADGETKSEYHIRGISDLGWEAIKRRLNSNILSIPGLDIHENTADILDCSTTYRFCENTGIYELKK